MSFIDELEYAASDFLCSECKKPLYFRLDSKEEVCVNPNCMIYPAGLNFHDARQLL